jgi:hypothetical protein
LGRAADGLRRQAQSHAAMPLSLEDYRRCGPPVKAAQIAAPGGEHLHRRGGLAPHAPAGGALARETR